MTLQTTPLGIVVLVLSLALLAVASAALTVWVARTNAKRSEDTRPAQSNEDLIDQLRAQLQALRHAQKAALAELADCRAAIARLDRDRQPQPNRTTVESPRGSETGVSPPTPQGTALQKQSPPLAKEVEHQHRPSAEKQSPVRTTARPTFEPPAVPQPLPRPAPFVETPRTEPELSDEEIDALPPELPSPDKPRKRILPPPRKPTLRSL